MKIFLQTFLFFLFVFQSSYSQWIQQSSGTTEGLLDVNFIYANIGTVVGENGTILRTTDGGETWIQQTSGTDFSLNGVSFIDANTGTVVGEMNGAYSIILNTTNGGSSWVEQSNPSPSSSYYDICFTDENNGTIVGGFGNYVILRTTDAGTTWFSQDAGITSFLRGVSFSNLNIGTAVGGHGNIIRTTDGGTIWIPQISGTSARLNDVYFTNANDGTVVGHDADSNLCIILRTSDGGTTWIPQLIGTTGSLSGVSFYDANNGIAVGHNGLEGIILRTTNGGSIWSAETSPFSVALYNVCFIDENNGWIVGQNGTILKISKGSNEFWNELEVSGILPLSRSDHTAIYDPQDKQMIIFGGWSSVPYNSLNDVWTFDLTANTWEEISTTGGPPANRAGHIAVYDDLRHRMVIFAGSNWWQTWYNDTWSLDLTTNTWMQLNTTGGPPTNRYFHCGIYDSNRDRLIIFGGDCGSTTNHWYGNDTWALDFTSLEWTQLSTTNNPEAREECSAVLDEANDRMIIFGGRESTYFSDTWALNLSTYEWSHLGDFVNTVGCHAAVFNPQDNRMIAVAGWGLYDHGQVAILSTTDDIWLNLNISGDIPSSRQNPSAIWDPVSQRVIMFGGDPGPLNSDYNDVWQFSNTITSVKSETVNPVKYLLSQNYPNPFNPSTKIRYSVPQVTNIVIRVFDILGNEIETLVNKEKPAGTYEITWYAEYLSSGVYFYQLRAGSFVETKKMILLR